MSTYEEREAARRSRIDPLARAKINRRVAEDRERLSKLEHAASDLIVGKWYWITILDRRWPGKVLAVVEGFGVSVGVAELGTVQLVAVSQVGSRMNPKQLTDHLRREPVHREWPLESELISGMTRVAGLRRITRGSA